MDETKRRWLQEAGYGDKDAKLLDDFAASGDSCAKAVDKAFARAGVSRDINERRKAVGALMARVRKLKSEL